MLKVSPTKMFQLKPSSQIQEHTLCCTPHNATLLMGHLGCRQDNQDQGINENVCDWMWKCPFLAISNGYPHDLCVLFDKAVQIAECNKKTVHFADSDPRSNAALHPKNPHQSMYTKIRMGTQLLWSHVNPLMKSFRRCWWAQPQNREQVDLLYT